MSQTVSVPQYYTYYQNNSGGDFDEDEQVCQYVIIQALSPDQADARAESIGIYFNGVSEGKDCRCCGDRWYPASEHSAVPTIWGKSPDDYKPIFRLNKGQIFCRVYHLNGTITEYSG